MKITDQLDAACEASADQSSRYPTQSLTIPHNLSLSIVDPLTMPSERMPIKRESKRARRLRRARMSACPRGLPTARGQESLLRAGAAPWPVAQARHSAALLQAGSLSGLRRACFARNSGQKIADGAQCLLSLAVHRHRAHPMVSLSPRHHVHVHLWHVQPIVPHWARTGSGSLCRGLLAPTALGPPAHAASPQAVSFCGV